MRKFWNWKGYKIAWQVEGKRNNNRTAIVMIHGFGACKEHWRFNQSTLGSIAPCYAIDLIGFGDSDQPGIRQIGRLNNEIWCNQVKDFIAQVIRPKNSEKIVLIGNSLGSLVALTCAVSLEDQIATVIASPLPDQIREYKKSVTKKSLFKKLQRRLLKIK